MIRDDPQCFAMLQGLLDGPAVDAFPVSDVTLSCIHEMIKVQGIGKTHSF